METKTITQFNKEALINVSRHLHFSDVADEPVVKHATFYGYAEIAFSITSIFKAIEIMGRDNDPNLLVHCTQLAVLGQKIFPSEELYFLDELLTEENKKLTPTKSLNSL